MKYNSLDYKTLTLATAIVFLFSFCLFVFFYEKYEYKKARYRIEQHAVVISNSLWNLNPEGSEEYLSLACKSHNYKIITVVDNKGELFRSAEGYVKNWSERFLTLMHLIPKIKLESDVKYNGRKIGVIKAVWKCDTIYLELYVLLAMILTYSICYLNIRLITANSLLEKRVKERTMELSVVNASLQVELEEHQKAREALKKSEEQYRILIDNIPDIVYRTDMEGNILFMSRSSEAISGYSVKEVIGKKVTDLFYINPYERDDFLSTVEQKGYVNNYEEKLKRKDGTIWWASTNAHFFKDENGNISGIEGVLRDVTEKKMLESQLRQAQKMESIGTLTGGIAHDFNNILNIMLGNAELAMEDIEQHTSAYHKIEAIRAAGQKASSIVKQLLSFSRKTDMELKPINVAPIVRESIQLLKATIPSNIEIRGNIQPEINDTILGHSTQIHQIIINLCINASHAMEKMEEGKIDINVENIVVDKSENLKITITDSGIGIAPEIMDKIFDPYFTTKPVDKGTGMGLAVVHGIVKNHSGVITVHSKPSHGTTFTIVLPLHEQKSKTDNEKEAFQDNLYYGTERILIVDDDEFIVDMTNEMLERLGYNVESKGDPEEALELFMANPSAFDLIITDMTMPNMTGAKLAQKVKQIRADIPIIVSSGYSAELNEDKAKDTGIAAYLMKPVSMQELGQTIRDVLGQSKIN
ncbi:MAG: PAS domain S-box protein [Desulfamplus sp.]|nr:PAS domain S-box protein [Desulfamplus sp.]